MSLSLSDSIETLAPQQTVSKKWLIAIYSIVPLAFLVVLIDQFFLSAIIQKRLPTSPEDWFVINIILGLPHIIASFVMYCDQEYFHFYKNKLVLPIVLICLGVFILPDILGKYFIIAYIIAYLWTMKHVFNQQAGIMRMMTGTSNRLFTTWKWSSFIIVVSAFYSSFASYYGMKLFALNKIFWLVFWLIMVVFCVCSFLMYLESKNKLARIILFSNILLLLVIVAFMFLNYSFLMLLIPRIIHDATAFYFYSVHDQNRNYKEPKNLMYQFFNIAGFNYRKWNIPIWVICLSVSFTLTVPFVYYGDNFWVESTVVCLSLIHNYTDSFSWKKDSPLRKFIPIQ